MLDQTTTLLKTEMVEVIHHSSPNHYTNTYNSNVFIKLHETNEFVSSSFKGRHPNQGPHIKGSVISFARQRLKNRVAYYERKIQAMKALEAKLERMKAALETVK